MDIQYKLNILSIEQVKENIPEVLDALKWVLLHYTTYDEQCLNKLAIYLHNSSLNVILRDNTDLSAGGEHHLYNKLYDYQKNNELISATHGQIVGIGTLITAYVFCKMIENYELYNNLKQAFKKLLIPHHYDGLNNIGIPKQVLINALSDISDKSSILGDFFSQNDFSILDEIFKKLS
ncbi:hypothetical protein BJL95_16935 [Methylomonas sp. LWB]|nr:hypothetical protein BJL95_16935 [Methylomonas sp. LWB]